MKKKRHFIKIFGSENLAQSVDQTSTRVHTDIDTFTADWGPEVDVVGFCFLDLAKDYKPPETLLKWLDAGEKPIYVGFGSLVISSRFRIYMFSILHCHFLNYYLYHFSALGSLLRIQGK